MPEVLLQSQDRLNQSLDLLLSSENKEDEPSPLEPVFVASEMFADDEMLLTTRDGAIDCYARLSEDAYFAAIDSLSRSDLPLEGTGIRIVSDTSDRFYTDRETRYPAINIELESGVGLAVFLPNHYRTLDGMVKIQIPLGDRFKDAATISTDLTSCFNDILGLEVKKQDFENEPLFSQKERAWKYRHNLPDDKPLTDDELKRVNELELKKVAPTHYAFVDTSDEEGGLFSREGFRFTHYTHDYVNVARIIEGGGLMTTLRRWISGTNNKRQSSELVDMSHGGGDEVFTHIHKKSVDAPNSSHAAQFFINPRVMQRMDVRALPIDTYGRNQATTMTKFDEMRTDGTPEIYEDDIQDGRYHDQRRSDRELIEEWAGLEVTFKGGIALEDIDFVSADASPPRLNESDWPINPKSRITKDTNGNALPLVDFEKLRKYWGRPAVIGDYLRSKGWTPDQIKETEETFTPARKLILRDLRTRGITEVNGQPIEKFVVESFWLPPHRKT